jgi:hypothetical protein
VTIEEQGLPVLIPIPKNPWADVTIADVENFSTAVDTYFFRNIVSSVRANPRRYNCRPIYKMTPH